ncbi:S8 family serine peptidase [Mycolicibacterium sp. XJ1819]
MVSVRPAYSAPFHDSRITKVPALDPRDGITTEWAWGDGTGRGVKVAVIDSGVDTHPDVGPVDGYVSITEDQDGELVYDPAPHDDSFGHGTACAGVIRRLAPECELYSVKVLGAGLTGTGRIFQAGLRWAIDNGIRVCNLSLGSKKREYCLSFHELADQAYFKNVILVTAANNSPIPSYPSLYSSVISVASHAIPDPYVFYYNPEPPVEFGAHGIDVRLPWRGGKYITATGNSFAAPHISGLITKILGAHPNLTVFQTETILCELATNVSRTEVTAPPRLLGASRQRKEDRSD